MTNLPPVCSLWIVFVAISWKYSDCVGQEIEPTHSRDRVIEFDWPGFDLNNVTTDSSAMLPQQVKSLGGHRIRVEGYMSPTFKQKGISRFVLRAFMSMKPGAADPIDSVMLVQMEGSKAVDFSTALQTIEGTLTVDEWLRSDAGNVVCVYRLLADHCEPAHRSKRRSSVSTSGRLK